MTEARLSRAILLAVSMPGMANRRDRTLLPFDNSLLVILTVKRRAGEARASHVVNAV